jgi:dipeptidase E
MCSLKKNDPFVFIDKKIEMPASPKLFLYSLSVSPEQCRELTKLVGKEPGQIKIAVIENAADIIPNSADWLGGFRQMLTNNGYRIEVIDLRTWMNDKPALQEKLRSKDVLWLGGGHTYYLRWILKESGADEIIKELVKQGKVYAGWSAGAVMAGPTTLYFDAMGDNPDDAPEYITEALQLTEMVIVPHMNNPDFAEGAAKTNEQLIKAGFKTYTLKDDEVLVIKGEEKYQA